MLLDIYHHTYLMIAKYDSVSWPLIQLKNSLPINLFNMILDIYNREDFILM